MQDIKECKAFLKAKMDSIMLQLYKENLTLQQMLNTATSQKTCKTIFATQQNNSYTFARIWCSRGIRIFREYAHKPSIHTALSTKRYN